MKKKSGSQSKRKRNSSNTNNIENQPKQKKRKINDILKTKEKSTNHKLNPNNGITPSPSSTLTRKRKKSLPEEKEKRLIKTINEVRPEKKILTTNARVTPQSYPLTTRRMKRKSMEEENFKKKKSNNILVTPTISVSLKNGRRFPSLEESKSIEKKKKKLNLTINKKKEKEKPERKRKTPKQILIGYGDNETLYVPAKDKKRMDKITKKKLKQLYLSR